MVVIIWKCSENKCSENKCILRTNVHKFFFYCNYAFSVDKTTSSFFMEKLKQNELKKYNFLIRQSLSGKKSKKKSKKIGLDSESINLRRRKKFVFKLKF